MDNLAFLKYFHAYKKLCELHKQSFGNSKGVNVPVLFSEELCRMALALDHYDGKLYDAVKDDKYIEIKSTCFPNRTTTFSSYANPDLVYWVCVDVFQNEIRIYDITLHYQLKKIDASNQNSHNVRYTITFDKNILKSDPIAVIEFNETKMNIEIVID